MTKRTELFLILITGILSILHVVVFVDSFSYVQTFNWILNEDQYYDLYLVISGFLVLYTAILFSYSIKEARSFQSTMGVFAIIGSSFYLIIAISYGNPYFFLQLVAYVLSGYYLYELFKRKNIKFIIAVIGFVIILIGNTLASIIDNFAIMDGFILAGFMLLLIHHILQVKDAPLTYQRNKQKRQNEVQFCTHCGDDIEEDIFGCFTCGLDPRMGHHYCPHCGAPRFSHEEICDICGKSTTVLIIKKRVDIDGTIILAFILPIFGFIMFIFNITRRPKFARVVGKYALFSTGLRVMILSLILLFGFDQITNLM